MEKAVSLKNGRNSIFELLRLFAMFMVVLEHCLLASVLYTDKPLCAIDNIGWFIEAFTVCAVNLFFLLTGYYQKSDNFKLSRFAEIWLKTIFYSVVIYLIFVIFGADSFSAGTLISYLCPVFFKKYWFMQTYIALALLAPFISASLDKLSEQKYLLLICILLIFFSFHQTFLPVAKTLDTTQGYGIVWGGILLIVGKFLQKYGDKYIERARAGLFLLGYITIACGIFVTNYLIVRYDIAQGVTSRSNFYAYNSISVFGEGVCLFCFFIKLSRKGKLNQTINWLSASSLSIYLISAHPDLLIFLWTDILKIGRFITNPVMYIVGAVGATLAIMLMCILIDKIVIIICKSVHFDRLLLQLNSTRFNHMMNHE